MFMRKVLLKKRKSKESVNETNIIPVELNRDISVLNNEILIDTVDTLKLYNDEKDKSFKHRLIFTLNPLCSNVLYNNITEIVYDEGCDNSIILRNNEFVDKFNDAISDENVDRIQAIRNTEYSNEIFNLTYHPGVDFFNNHLFRSIDNVSVQKKKKNDKNNCKIYDENDKIISELKDSFNTIGDFSRNFYGDKIIVKMPDNSDYIYSNGGIDTYLPLYTAEDIKSFFDGYSDSLKKENGWVGFHNQSTIKIPVKDNYYINKNLNNKEACQFIDMSPERELFSFTPHKNNKRKRIEYNWDYFITYPYKSIYEDSYILKGKEYGLPIVSFDDKNSKFYHDYIADNNDVISMFRTIVKHNLRIGDHINIVFETNGNIKKIKCRVVKLGSLEGEYKDRYFCVKKSDYTDFIDDESKPVSFLKLVNGYECEYYFRKFKVFDKKLKSSINKLAFANTIYGDEVSQIVFTDDIDTYYVDDNNMYTELIEIKDNRGRPLTELYLTIIKSNRGHDLWYEENNSSNELIEVSHVFGKITSGLDLPTYAGFKKPTVRYQHNISDLNLNIINNEYRFTGNNSNITFNVSSVKLEDDIKISMDEFYGDLVEFNPIEFNETVLEDVLHRFNTAQRETRNELYNTIYYDEIHSDIYDGGYYGSKNVNSTRILQHKLHEGYANLAPEGYLYKPHHKIQIALFDDNVKQDFDSEINVLNVNLLNNNKRLVFTTKNNLLLVKNDEINIFNKKTFDKYSYIVSSYYYDSDVKLYVCNCDIKNGSDILLEFNTDNYYVFKHNHSIPEYAYMIPNMYGYYIWRDIKLPSEYKNTDVLYDTPFTNGSFYHHTLINFPVRRQDPFGEYKMFMRDNNLPLENNFEVPSTKLDNSVYEHVLEKDFNSCF